MQVVGELVGFNLRSKEFEIFSEGRFIAGSVHPSLIRRNDLTISRNYLFFLEDGIMVDAVRILNWGSVSGEAVSGVREGRNGVDDRGSGTDSAPDGGGGWGKKKG